MSDPKTRPTAEPPQSHIDSHPDESRRAEGRLLLDLMKRATGEPPILWGGSIVGFGNYHYRYATGREGDWFLAGFALRKREISIYVMAGFAPFEDLLRRLGPHRRGACCLYLKELKRVDLAALEEMIRRSAALTRDNSGCPKPESGGEPAAGGKARKRASRRSEK